MASSEWTLVIFTITTQMCAGTFIMAKVLPMFAGGGRDPELTRANDSVSLFMAPLLVVAMLISLLHLGTPTNAINTVRNIAVSPLSWEILAGGLFTGLVCLLALAQWQGIGSESLRRGIGWLVVLSGVAMVVSMTLVYTLRTVPVWNSMLTPIQFSVATLLLGTLAWSAILAALVKKQSMVLQRVWRIAAVVTLALLGVKLVTLPIAIAGLAVDSETGLASVRTMSDQLGFSMLLKLVLAFAGAGFGALVLYRNVFREEGNTATGIYIAFGLVLIAEVVGRSVFYASYVRVGLLN